MNKTKKRNSSEKNNFLFYTEVNKDNNINHIELIKNPIFQKELIFFKNEILKDINELTKEISEKYEKLDLIIKSETTKLNSLISNSDTKIKNLSNLISINNHTQEKLNSLITFKQKAESYMTSNDIHLTNLEQNFSSDINRHDNIIKESIIYPGVIGPSAQFKNFHDLIDYFLINVTEILKYKEKSSADFITYKSKLNDKFYKFQKNINDYVDDINHMNKKKLNKFEDKFSQINIKINDFVDSIKIENENFQNNIIQNNKIFIAKVEENIKHINEDNIQIKNKLKKIAHKEQKELNNNIINKTASNYKHKNAKYRNSIQNSFSKESNIKNNISKFSQESNNLKNKSNTSYSNKNERNNLENRLKQFIKEEMKKINKNYNISKNTLDKELNRNSKIFYSEKQKKPIKKTLSHGKKFSYSKIDKINDVNLNKKRSTLIPNNLNKNIFDNFLKSNEDKNENDYEKIKEAFSEESSKSSGTYKQISKESEKNIDKDIDKNTYKKLSNKTLTEENSSLNEPEFKLDNNIYSYRTLYDLPPFIKPEKEQKEISLTKPEQTKDEKTETIPEIINKNTNIFTINKNPKKRVSLLSLNFSNSFSSNLEKNNKNINNINNLKREIKKPILNNKEILDANIKFNTLENFKEEKKEIIIKPNNTIDNNIINNNNINNNTINTNITERKNNIKITSPKIKPIPKLNNFEITLKGTKKFNIDSIPNKKHLFNSPTIYMNFPRKYSVYSEKFLESLHPLYRNKKFSNVIPTYISLMTNNLQDMIRYYDKKNVQQRKRNLPLTNSDNFLLNKKKDKNKINLDMNFDKEKNKNQYKKIGNDYIKLDDENDMISYNKFRNLIMKDI